jgi:uncharacterized membrane protein
MPVIYRVWVDVEVYDPATEETTTVEVDFGPAATFVARDESLIARAAAEVRAVDFAEQLQDARARLAEGVAS